jgi:Tol biopolymer transport system component
LIAYDSDVAGPTEIYVMHPNGSHKRRLTTSHNNAEPSWSPDGRRIAFEHGAKTASLSVMGANGSQQRRLTRGHVDTAARWTPDGRYISFTRGSNCYQAAKPACDIWLIRPDGTGLRQVTHDGQASTSSFSPDSKQFAFTHQQPDFGREDVYVMNADGTGGRNLTGGLHGDSYDPAWSPDGKTIAFTYHACPDCDQLLAFLSLQDGRVRYFNFRYGGGSVPVQEHAWSPDSKWIVFATQQTLWVVDFATLTKAKRVAYAGDNHDPAWQTLRRKP